MNTSLAVISGAAVEARMAFLSARAAAEQARHVASQAGQDADALASSNTLIRMLPPPGASPVPLEGKVGRGMVLLRQDSPTKQPCRV